MKKCLRICIVTLTLASVVAWLPTMAGCSGKKNPKANPEFKEENLDPTKVKMQPIGGPGSKPAAPTTK